MFALIPTRIAIAAAICLLACDGDTVPSSSASAWAEGDVIYSVLVRGFFDSNADGDGDIIGLTEKLDVLNDGAPGGDDLGVSVLSVMPIAPAVDVLGYQCLNHAAIDSSLGTEADTRALIDAAHARGMAVVVEVPLLHVSGAHEWFAAALHDSTGDARARFRWRDDDPGWTVPWPGFKSPTWHASDHGGAYYSAFGPHLPMLNVDNPDVRAAMLESVDYWTGLGVDGIVIPAASFAVPTGPEGGQWNTDETIAFWAAFDDDVFAAHPEVGVMLDLSGGPLVGRRYIEANSSLRVTSSGFAEALAASVLRQRATDLRVDFDSRDGNSMVLAASGSTLPRLGERFVSLEQSRAAMVVQLTLAGSPQLFYGEEVGADHNDTPAEVSRFVPFAWTPEPPAHGFTTGTRAWNAFSKNAATANLETVRGESGSIYDVARGLLALRSAHPAIARGSCRLLTKEGAVAPVFAFMRELDDERFVVAVNMTSRPAGVGPVDVDGSSASPVWSTDGVGDAVARDGKLQFTLPPNGAAVWRVTG